MNSLINLDPFRDMESFGRSLSSLINGGWGRPTEHAAAQSDWLPRADVSEDAKEYLIKFELPEIKKEDVKVVVEDGVLTVSGHRKLEKESSGGGTKKYHRIERFYGSFVRRFDLPENVDTRGVNAEFKDGVLNVHLRKSEEARPQLLEVKVT